MDKKWLLGHVKIGNGCTCKGLGTQCLRSTYTRYLILFFIVPIIVLYAEFLLFPSDCRKEKTTNQAWKQFCSPAAGCKWLAITPRRRSKIKICIFRLRGHSGCERRHGQTFSWLATIFKMSGKVMAYLSEAALLSWPPWVETRYFCPRTWPGRTK